MSPLVFEVAVGTLRRSGGSSFLGRLFAKAGLADFFDEAICRKAIAPEFGAEATHGNEMSMGVFFEDDVAAEIRNGVSRTSKMKSGWRWERSSWGAGAPGAERTDSSLRAASK